MKFTGLKATKEAISNDSGKVETLYGSVADREFLKSAIFTFHESFQSPISIGINCAGKQIFTRFKLNYNG